MKIPGALDHPKLRKFIHKAPAGTLLFKQGQPGNTLFILLEGCVHLLSEHQGRSHIAGIVRPIDFLGEKAFIQKVPYFRHFAAKAETDITVIEMSGKDLDFLRVAVPDIMLEIMAQLFQKAIARIEDLNFLVSSLRPEREEDRLAGALIYLSRHLGKNFASGSHFPLSIESLQALVEVESTTAARFLADVTRAEILKQVDDRNYQLRSESALVDYLKSQGQPLKKSA